MFRLILVGVVVLGRLAVADVAIGGPGVPFSWATSSKDGFGTAYEAYDGQQGFSASSPTAPISRVWFTIARGILSEVYYPRVDIAQTRDTQLLITDGKTFLHQEQYDTEHQTERVAGAPLYRIINRDRQKRYAIFKEIWADPDSDTIVQKIRIERYVEGLQFYVLHKPTAANSIFGDSAQTGPFIAGEDDPVYGAWQGLGSTLPWEKTSVGYVGISDGYTDLNTHAFQMTYTFSQAPQGNVALTGKIAMPETAGSTELTLFLFFQKSAAQVSQQYHWLPSIDVGRSERLYRSQWREYLDGASLPVGTKPSEKRRQMLETSLLVLKCAEDKMYPGALVAAPAVPWGEAVVEKPGQRRARVAGYHTVWPRDLYHMAGALVAAGDLETPVAILNRFRAVQFHDSDGKWTFGTRVHARAGSFPQNFWVDGKVVQWGYQADQTGMPVLLTYRLWKLGLIRLSDYWPMVRAAARFLAEMGPWTQQERWEEHYGISPNSASYAIGALVAASEMAYDQKDGGNGEYFLICADLWATKNGDNIDTWTFTSKGRIQGPLGNGKYYLRFAGSAVDMNHAGAPIYDATWDPNADPITFLPNIPGAAAFKPETEIVDAGFLDLVRVGVHAASNYFVRESLPETDAILRKETPHGPGWYRYRYDGYGEEGRGRLWPILTGERIHYQLQWLKESLEANIPAALEPMIQTYESFASDQQIFSEQVWDEGDSIARPSGSAAPLCWAHAEYIQLLRSVQDRAIFEENKAVRDRYGSF